MNTTRREFLQTAAAATVLTPSLAALANEKPAKAGSKMRLGLVTYNWGKGWDIPTIIKNCSVTGFEGVELRSTHKHGVEINIDKKRRAKVAAIFADSDVELVGLGSACEYHSADPAVVKKNIEETKAFIKLCHDVGGTGVKVRPNGLPKDVPEEKTLEQIGKSLNEVAKFGNNFGVQIRLEVHGRGTAEIPRIQKIMEVADNKNTVLCWNCNPTDLKGDGLEKNFQSVQDRVGINHIHDLRDDRYPWKQFFGLLKAADFEGWTLIEEGRVPKDIVGAMRENRPIWEKLAGA
ncbi:MAG: xylose isomerase [Planctomycetaceae bacterium]|nr:xylose isomerase [Planctomycetaceae bacterium]